MNELMTKGVCRRALATLGLLIGLVIYMKLSNLVLLMIYFPHIVLAV